jgi:hypothetical protein
MAQLALVSDIRENPEPGLRIHTHRRANCSPAQRPLADTDSRRFDAVTLDIGATAFGPSQLPSNDLAQILLLVSCRLKPSGYCGCHEHYRSPGQIFFTRQIQLPRSPRITETGGAQNHVAAAIN